MPKHYSSPVHVVSSYTPPSPERAAHDAFKAAMREHLVNVDVPYGYERHAFFVRDITALCWAAARSSFGDKANPTVTMQMVEMVLSRWDGTPDEAYDP